MSVKKDDFFSLTLWRILVLRIFAVLTLSEGTLRPLMPNMALVLIYLKWF